MKVPLHTANAVLESMVSKIESRCGAKIEAKTKGIFMAQIRGIITSLEMRDGALVHDGFIRAHNNAYQPKEAPLTRRRWRVRS